jgi:molybdopterin synthase sulfur carrier subunit
MRLIYFAWLRDKIGCAQEEIRLPPGVTNVGQLIDWLSGRSPRYDDAFEFIEVIKVLVNQSLVPNDYPVSDDDEVIFVPPIGGG